MADQKSSSNQLETFHGLLLLVHIGGLLKTRHVIVLIMVEISIAEHVTPISNRSICVLVQNSAFSLPAFHVSFVSVFVPLMDMGPQRELVRFHSGCPMFKMCRSKTESIHCTGPNCLHSCQKLRDSLKWRPPIISSNFPAGSRVPLCQVRYLWRTRSGARKATRKLCDGA